MSVRSILFSYLRLPLVIRLVLLALLSIVLFGTIIHFIEPGTFPTIFEGMWWAIVTISTVGYGDYSPTTEIGRAVGMLLILVGTAFMTFYFVTLSAATISLENSFAEGKSTFKGENHVILIGWNERIRETLVQLNGTNDKLQIVLVDETLKENPLSDRNITFIKGDPSNDDTLRRANIEVAAMIIISADQSKNESHADMATILTLVTAKGMNPSIYTIVEILTKNQIINAKRAGADEVIQTNKLTSYVMANSIMSHGMSDALLIMLDNLSGNKIEYILVPEEIEGLSYEECIKHLIKKGILLIGIKRRDESFINPSPTFSILKTDELLIIRH
ncbi:potassium channel family protein [Bacillus suaedaesalsae]|uniref:NAD-binding protein n=1 Tax=Bacillus suaedaesalsae TaxID=2810349 RepID=A0ABS2DK10_9BACI|nr:potassium channel family protein [Bacillus suaedaesalsae]MBM6618736.1 NAD-binding protein [Bacillus suaedaesalsae]